MNKGGKLCSYPACVWVRKLTLFTLRADDKQQSISIIIVVGNWVNSGVVRSSVAAVAAPGFLGVMWQSTCWSKEQKGGPEKYRKESIATVFPLVALIDYTLCQILEFSV